MTKNPKETGFHSSTNDFPREKIAVWLEGQMPFSAIRRINELKAKRQEVSASAMLKEWNLAATKQ